MVGVLAVGELDVVAVGELDVVVVGELAVVEGDVAAVDLGVDLVV